MNYLCAVNSRFLVTSNCEKFNSKKGGIFNRLSIFLVNPSDDGVSLEAFLPYKPGISHCASIGIREVSVRSTKQAAA